MGRLIAKCPLNVCWLSVFLVLSHNKLPMRTVSKDLLIAGHGGRKPGKETSVHVGFMSADALPSAQYTLLSATCLVLSWKPRKLLFRPRD